jgi:hypothetical protein
MEVVRDFSAIVPTNQVSEKIKKFKPLLDTREFARRKWVRLIERLAVDKVKGLPFLSYIGEVCKAINDKFQADIDMTILDLDKSIQHRMILFLAEMFCIQEKIREKHDLLSSFLFECALQAERVLGS